MIENKYESVKERKATREVAHRQLRATTSHGCGQLVPLYTCSYYLQPRSIEPVFAWACVGKQPILARVSLCRVFISMPRPRITAAVARRGANAMSNVADVRSTKK